MILRFFLIVGIPILLSIFAHPAFAEQTENLLNMVNGSVLISKGSEYNTSGWSAFCLFDDDPAAGWSSEKGKPDNNSFVVELPQTYRLKQVTFDNVHTQESGYPGISARKVQVYCSTEAPGHGYTLAKTFELNKGEKQSFDLDMPIAHWLRFTIVSNFGNKDYTELMGIAMTGVPIGPKPNPRLLSGVYDTNYGPLRLEQDGDLVSGCYYNGDAEVTGSLENRVVRFQWKEPAQKFGTALMVLSSENFLNGLWYDSKGTMQGEWTGKLNPSLKVNCVKLDSKTSTVESQMRTQGRAILYGIHFDTDSANLTASSNRTLADVIAFLKKEPAIHAKIQGHTDSTNTAEYNRSLSQRRAQSVVDYLKRNGIDGARLSPQGFGEKVPVASNITPQGRALNRRVEISVTK